MLDIRPFSGLAMRNMAGWTHVNTSAANFSSPDRMGWGAMRVEWKRYVLASKAAGRRIGRQATPPQYLIALEGKIIVNGHEADPRDGTAITSETKLVIEAIDDAEIVLFDVR